MKIRTFVELRNFGRNLDLHFIGQRGDKEVVLELANENELRWVPVVDELPSSSPWAPITLNQAAGQELMDGLWQCGLRPTRGSGSAGSLEATQRHLEDMRAIVFKGLEVDAPRAK